MKIIVLAGGTSTEREVSIVSGENVCRALRSKGHQAVLLDVFSGDVREGWETAFDRPYDVEKEAAYIRSMSSDIAEVRKKRRDFFGPHVIALCQMADFTFLALHGANGEDGKVQAALDLYDIQYTGCGCLGSAIAMDKALSKKILSQSGVPTPSWICLQKDSNTDITHYGMQFPVVVKLINGGSSIGVYIVQDEKEYQAALREAFSREREVLVESYISGREFTVSVVDETAYPVVEIAPKEGFYDYRNKYEPGSTVETCPAELSRELTEKMQDYAVQGYRALCLEAYARLDFLMDEKGEMYCLEANTLPGMTPTSLIPQEAQALGMDFPALCEELIRVSRKKYES